MLPVKVSSCKRKVLAFCTVSLVEDVEWVKTSMRDRQRLRPVSVLRSLCSLGVKFTAAIEFLLIDFKCLHFKMESARIV